MTSIWETLWPPNPTFTESNCPDLTSHTYLVTGGATGIGFELAQLLYSRNAFVYIAGRSQITAERAILKAVEKYPRSTGRIEFWKMDLEDLKDVRRSAGEFLEKVQVLNGLVCNAGVSFVEKGRRTVQVCDTHFLSSCNSAPFSSNSSSLHSRWCGTNGMKREDERLHGKMMIETMTVQKTDENNGGTYIYI